jgi:hypothetical protein
MNCSRLRFATLLAACALCMPPDFVGARAQDVVVCYQAPVASYSTPAAQPFVGASYSLYTPARVSTSYYVPAYTAPTVSTARYSQPGPYFYTPTYSYTPGYYSYYYTPGWFRY